MCCFALDNTNIDCITYINTVKVLREFVECIYSYYLFDPFCSRFTDFCMCICSFLNVDVQILQIQMCQKLQEEAKPKKNKMDQSI